MSSRSYPWAFSIVMSAIKCVRLRMIDRSVKFVALIFISRYRPVNESHGMSWCAVSLVCTSEYYSSIAPWIPINVLYANLCAKPTAHRTLYVTLEWYILLTSWAPIYLSIDLQIHIHICTYISLYADTCTDFSCNRKLLPPGQSIPPFFLLKFSFYFLWFRLLALKSTGHMIFWPDLAFRS